MKASAHPIDLEQRVADFAARVIGVCEKLPDKAVCARVLEGVLVPHVDFCTRKKCSLLVQEPIRNGQCD